MSVREVRQLAVAVALCWGDTLPGSIVPVSYEDDMHELLAAREGLGWRTACEWCGLEVPDESKVARALRGQLRDL